MSDFLSSYTKKYPELPFALPFIVFLLLTAIPSVIPNSQLWVYPLKTVVTALLLLLFWEKYLPFGRIHPLWAIGVGVFVFFLWILPEGMYPLLEESKPLDPYQQMSAPWVYLWITVRLLGSCILVPIMEEIFWRLFLIRWIVDPDFEKVPVGQFHWGAFIITSILFGFEHNRWLVGIGAGVAYNLLLFRTKSIMCCIVAHGITNLILGLYVLHTGNWTFW